MTQYAPHGPTRAPRHGWYNYRFDAADLRCAGGCPPGTHPLYIGKSNEPWARVLEHAGTQSWFEHVTGWRLYPQVYASDEVALAAERHRIRTERPVANIEHNKGNRCRLYFPPLAGGEPHPVRAQPRRSRSTTGRPTPAPARRATSKPRPNHRRIAKWLALWALLAVLLPPVFMLFGRVPAGEALVGGPIAATSLLVLVAALRPKRRRR